MANPFNGKLVILEPSPPPQMIKKERKAHQRDVATQSDTEGHSYEVPRGVKFTETESRWWVPGAGGGRERGVFTGDQVGEDEKGSGDGWW